MELATEDQFRLNVLLASKPLAVRIDESRLIVHGLSDKGEARIPLHPTGRLEQYVRAVKELISGYILGSPGGYPVYLRRWTRMGQMRDQSLEQLLMLGEPEAVIAAVSSPGLTEELARRAWWAMEDAENARRMLENPGIAQSAMGAIFVDYLLEHLPFETETDTVTASVRLILQSGRIDDAEREELWMKSARKQACLVGFLAAIPDRLPRPVPARSDADQLGVALQAEIDAGNAVARLLRRLVGAQGQTYLKTVSAVLAKPPNQDVVIGVFDCLRDYFAPVRPGGDPRLVLDELVTDGQRFVAAAQTPGPVRACLAAAPSIHNDLIAMRILSGTGYSLIRPVLSDPTTLGSLMRRKLRAVIEPLQAQIQWLCGDD
ncbi:MAG: sulfur reduction protein DsrS [Thiohalocapsa sp.]